MSAADILKGLSVREDQFEANRFVFTRMTDAGPRWLMQAQFNGELTAQRQREVAQLIVQRVAGESALAVAARGLLAAAACGPGEPASSNGYTTSRLGQHFENVAAALDGVPLAVPLAADHTAMRVDHSGMLRSAASSCRRGQSDADAFMLEELGRHMREMGERFYAGDLAAVDEFLQLYCVAREGREAVKAKGGAA